MKRKTSRMIGVPMLALALVFFAFALGRPKLSFPWNNTITYLLYGLYFIVAVILLAAPLGKKE